VSSVLPTGLDPCATYTVSPSKIVAAMDSVHMMEPALAMVTGLVAIVASAQLITLDQHAICFATQL
jgi:hypothetical protein